MNFVTLLILILIKCNFVVKNLNLNLNPDFSKLMNIISKKRNCWLQGGYQIFES